MGNTTTEPSSPTLSDDESVVLPVPLSPNSPECESLVSMTFHHPYTPTPSDHDEHSESEFPFPFPPVQSQISDCWNSYNPQKFGLNESPEKSHTIHRYSNINSGWMSVFGTQLVAKGDYKKWRLKIYPRHNTIKQRQSPFADLVIGVADARTIRSDNKRYNDYKGPFWREPFVGYGYHGLDGKKFHEKRKGKVHGQKFKVGDIITVELDLIQCNELKFYVNDTPNAHVSFHVDVKRQYVLALALCDDNYDVQILYSV
eukprot:166906_1